MRPGAWTGLVRGGLTLGVVVDDVDAALAALFAASKAKDQKLACAFDTPTPEWAAKVKSPTLNLFLVQIDENLDARPGAWTDVRDDNGQTIGRQPPLRRYDLRYLLSAWGDGHESNTGCSGPC